jgi:hypothetical protein
MTRSVIGAAALAPVLFLAGNREAVATPANCTYGSCAPSGTIINQIVTQDASDTTTNILSDRISQATGGGISSLDKGTSSSVFALGQGGTGKAAGSPYVPYNPWGIWAGVANTWVTDGQSGANFHGRLFDGMGGADYCFAADCSTHGAMLGLAVGYEHIDLTTEFNNGSLHSNGYALAPYAAYKFSPVYGVSGQIGHTWVNYKEDHGGINGSYDGDRWFGTVDVTAKNNFNAWQLASDFGLFYLNEAQQAFVETNGNHVLSSTPYVGEIRFKNTLGYEFTTGWGHVTPFASARLEVDPLQSSAPVVNSQGQTLTLTNYGATFGAGTNIAIGDAVTVNLEGDTIAFRRDLNAYGFNATVRIKY